jgi:hypothetical protein
VAATLIRDRTDRTYGGRSQLTAEASAFRGTLGIKITQCRSGDPEAKGLVERANGYLETSFLPSRCSPAPRTSTPNWLGGWGIIAQRPSSPADRVSSGRLAGGRPGGDGRVAAGRVAGRPAHSGLACSKRQGRTPQAAHSVKLTNGLRHQATATSARSHPRFSVLKDVRRQHRELTRTPECYTRRARWLVLGWPDAPLPVLGGG